MEIRALPQCNFEIIFIYADLRWFLVRFWSFDDTNHYNPVFLNDFPPWFSMTTATILRTTMTYVTTIAISWKKNMSKNGVSQQPANKILCKRKWIAGDQQLSPFKLIKCRIDKQQTKNIYTFHTWSPRFGPVEHEVLILKTRVTTDCCNYVSFNYIGL